MPPTEYWLTEVVTNMMIISVGSKADHPWAVVKMILTTGSDGKQGTLVNCLCDKGGCRRW